MINSTPIDDWLKQAPKSRVNYDDEVKYYDALYGDEDEGWGFWANLLHREEVVIEVGAGTGRLTRLLASLAGSVIGVEPAPMMLEAARRKLADLSNVRLVEGDYRTLPVPDSQASCVIYPYGVLSYSLNPAEQVAIIEEAFRAVRPGGHIVIDILYYPLNHPHTQGSVPLRIEGVIPLGQSSLTMFGASSLDADWNVCRYTEVIDEVGEDRFQRSIVYHDIHLFTPFEIYFLLRAAGFVVRSMFGGFDGSCPTRHSTRLIALGQRPF